MVLAALPLAVTMEFNHFGERRSSHWVKGRRFTGNCGLDSALERKPEPMNIVKRFTTLLVASLSTHCRQSSFLETGG
jgi:hypothetical protein